MKISHLLLAGLAVFGLAACSSDDDVSNGGNEPGINTGTYMTVSFTNPTSEGGNTRTEGPTGENSDNTIKNASIVLAKNGQIQYTVSATVKTNENGQFQSAPIEVPVGKYQVFAFVNPSHQVLNYIQQTGVPVRGIIELASQETAEIYAEKDNFSMMSQNNEVGSLGAFYTTVTNDNVISNPAKVTSDLEGKIIAAIPVQRFVAKLRNQTTDINIEGVKDLVDNNGNPLLKSAKVTGLVEINGIQKANTIQNWEKFTGSSTPEGKLLSIPEVTTGEEFYNQLDDIQASAITGELPTFKTEPIHLLENRPEVALMGNTSGVILAVQFELENGGNTFYYLEGIKNGSPYAAYFTNLDELKEVFQEIKLKELTDHILNNPELAGRNGLSIYNNNHAYYTYWVNDENYLIDGKRYPVVHRNTIYNLKVTKIFNMGPSIPGGTDPIDPEQPIKKETYIEVDVSVQPWIISNNEIEL